MADQDPNRKRDDAAAGDPANSDESLHKHDKDGEWLRDQTGEDHNLSGSSTFRTLPDQPTKDDGSADTEDRQSNR